MNDHSSWIKYMALGTSIATTLAGLVAGGYFLGNYLDQRWGTDPLLKVVLMILGVIFGIGFMITTLANMEKSKDEQ